MRVGWVRIGDFRPINQSINIRLLKSMAGRRPKQHEIQCSEYTKVTGELSVSIAVCHVC